MHLIFNTLSVTSDGGGIKTYLMNIISALVFLESKPKITLICSRSSYPVFESLKKQKNVRIRIIPVSSKINFWRIFLDQIVVPFLFLFRYNNKNDILVTPSSIATIFSPGKQITILQAPLVVKNIRKNVPAEFLRDFSIFKQIYYDTLLPKTLDKSDAVITVSNYLKKKVLESAALSDKIIEVVYEGVDIESFEKSFQNKDSRKTEILFVSTLYKYKNADKLIKAFGLAASEKIISEDLTLRIIGNDPSGGVYLNELRLIAKNSGVESRVVFDGYIPHKEIVAYYKKALMFVFPSSVETFGLPPLEAMASGVPVIASNRMSVPEIVGNAGIIIDPDNIPSIVQAIENISKDNNLRKHLVNKGYDHVQQFKWTFAAEKILEISHDISKKSV